MKIANIIQKLNEILAYLDDLQFDDRLPYDDYITLYDMISEPLQELEVGLPEELRIDAERLNNYFKKSKDNEKVNGRKETPKEKAKLEYWSVYTDDNEFPEPYDGRDDFTLMCSACKSEFWNDCRDGAEVMMKTWNYCPICGEKFDKR